MKRNVLFLVMAALVLLAAGYAAPLLSESVAAASGQTSTTGQRSAISLAPQFAALSDLEAAFGEIYTRVNPSVVAIQVAQTASTGTPSSPNLPDDHPSVPSRQGVGSGFIWDAQGHIVTNHHVVDGANRIEVVFADGSTLAAKVVGSDANSDLAVLKVDAPASLLIPVQMGDSRQLKVGQVAIAIGNPFGEENTMTTGIISAIGRSLPVSDGAFRGPTYTIPDVVQTDAPINPGNSGGVLLNAQGQVIGVTAAIESTTRASSGVGFAIPSAIVSKVVPALISTGRYDHAYIGISGATLTPSLAQASGVKTDQRGVLVATVTAGGPAEKAGIRGSTQSSTLDGVPVRVGGDIIVAVNGQPVKTFEDIVAYLANSTQVNQTITLTVLREGQQRTVQVTLAARPSANSAQ